MNAAGTPEQWRKPFPETEIPFILAAILRCSASIAKKEPCEHENRVTVRLWRRLRRDSEILTRPVHLDWETWEIEADYVNELGRLDLRYLYSTGVSHPWPCFAIEAKRLHVTFPKGGWKSLISDYVTTETQKPAEEEQGMMCFIIGRYSKGLLAGAMLGYVYDGEVDAARSALGHAIVEHAKKLKLAKPHELRISTIVQQEDRIMESLHELASGTFVIYHILVPV
jgi:hypothetical protein